MPGRRFPRQHEDTLVAEYNRRNWRGGLDGRSGVPRPVTEPLVVYQGGAVLPEEDPCVPIIGTVNSGTIAVPEGVTSGSHYFVAYVLGPYADWVGGSVTEPTGLNPYNSDGYNTGVEQQTALYEPFLHDGRASYAWTGFGEISIAYAFVPCASGYNSSSYDYFVDWAYSYPTFQNPKTGRDPMFWGDFYPDDPNWDPESKIFVGVWSARDEDNSRVLIGMVVEPPQAQYVGTEHWENLYTLPWPGSNTDNSEYDWTTDGFILDKAV